MIGSVRSGTILEKPLGAGAFHCRQSAALEDLQVSVLIHHHTCVKKAKLSPACGSEGTPDHHFGWMFHSFAGVLVLESIRSLWTPDTSETIPSEDFKVALI